MDEEFVPHEHQVAGFHKGEKSVLLRGKFGEVLKPVKLNANPTYCKHRALAILSGSGHNHQQADGQDDLRVVDGSGTLDKGAHISNILDDSAMSEANFTNKDEDMAAASADELGFYVSLQSCKVPLCNTLKNLLPQFLGTKTCSVNNIDMIHLVLEDLTYGMQYPCVADINIGRTSHYPGRVSHNKIIPPVLEELGFCLAGMKVVHPSTGDVIEHFEPDVGKKFNKDQVYDALDKLMQKGLSQQSTKLIEAVLQKLNEIHRWFNLQSLYKFRASSILITYDAKPFGGDLYTVSSEGVKLANDLQLSEPTAGISLNVKLIDFAHVLLAEGLSDDNYIFGLVKLKEVFSKQMLIK